MTEVILNYAVSLSENRAFVELISGEDTPEGFKPDRTTHRSLEIYGQQFDDLMAATEAGKPQNEFRMEDLQKAINAQDQSNKAKADAKPPETLSVTEKQKVPIFGSTAT